MKPLLWAALIFPAMAIAQTKQTFSDCADCPTMVRIEPGRFQMGTPVGAYEVHVESGEGPPIQIEIRKPYALSTTEITRGQFGAFVKATGYQTAGPCYVIHDGPNPDPDSSWRSPKQPAKPKDDHPVACVNFADARAYAAWLAKESGQPYRLPSEAEWEYAARAGTTTPRPWGANNSFEGVSISLTCDNANVYDITTQQVHRFRWPYARCTDGFVDVAPVASFPANAFGVHDMIGNLWEWTADCFTASYWGRPPDERPWVWEGGCERGVIRGGAWISRPANNRPARREDADRTSRANDLGFRVARDID